MRPNIDHGDNDELLIECNQHGEFIRFWRDKEDASWGSWVELIDRPASFLDLLRQWWRHRTLWHTEIQLGDSDVRAIKEWCDRLLTPPTNDKQE